MTSHVYFAHSNLDFDISISSSFTKYSDTLLVNISNF